MALGTALELRIGGQLHHRRGQRSILCPGNVVRAVFAYSDPNATAADFVINVNWGGAYSAEQTSLVLVSQSKTQSVWEVLGSVTYTADGTFTAAVSIADLWGSSIVSKDSKFHVTG